EFELVLRGSSGLGSAVELRVNMKAPGGVHCTLWKSEWHHPVVVELCQPPGENALAGAADTADRRATDGRQSASGVCLSDPAPDLRRVASDTWKKQQRNEGQQGA